MCVCLRVRVPLPCYCVIVAKRSANIARQNKTFNVTIRSRFVLCMFIIFFFFIPGLSRHVGSPNCLFIFIVHQWAAELSRGWANNSAFHLQVSLSCAVICLIVLLQYLSGASIPGLACLHWCRFLSYGLHFEAIDVPCPRQRHCSHIAHYKHYILSSV